MRNKLPLLTLLASLAGLCLIASLAGGWLLWSRFRPLPSEANQTLFTGITYQRSVRRSPRPMVIHVVKVNLKEKGLSFLVTPGDPDAELPLKARSTSQFLDEFGLQLAINGDGCTPWRSNGPLDYYPHAGDPVDPIGLAASQGVVYSDFTDAEPVLYLSRNNRLSFNNPGGKIYNAISGNLMLVKNGRPAEGLDASDAQPRTAIALNKNNRQMIIVIVDGRQPGYSQGATLAEMAQLLIDFGAHTGMNLDGGGSSTLVVEGENGKPVILNSPVDQNIPGKERVVGNHLGIFAERDN